MFYVNEKRIEMCEIVLSHQCPIEDLAGLKPEADISGNLSMKTGGGWTRTNVVRRRGIYSPLQLPLCDTPVEM